MTIEPLERVFARLREGQFVVLTADDSTGARADVVISAEYATPERVNFMVRFARGMVSVALLEARMRALGIPLVPSSRGSHMEPQGVLIEAREGVTTGISVADRSRTIQTVAAELSKPQDIVMPGHVLPLVALEGGLMSRAGRAEGAVDLMRLAGMRPCAALCTILRDDGEPADLSEATDFAQTHQLPLVFAKDLISYRVANETLVQRVEETPFPTAAGQLRAIVFRGVVDGREHLALVVGEVGSGRSTLVRIHSECLTGDVFASSRCDCGEQLTQSLEKVLAAGSGVIIYLHQEGRGIGLGNKIRAYALQDGGLDTVEANLELGFKEDLRDYGIGAQILRDLGVGEVELLTNNPHKLESLERYGVHATRVALEVTPHSGNIGYLRTKQEKLGHLFSRLKLTG